MCITSAARLRFDITYYINKLRNEQNRRLHNNSWLMALPLWCEIHWLPHATSTEMRYTFKQGIILQDDHLILPHHMPFTWMLSTQYIYCLQNLKHIINTTTIRLLQNFHHYYGDCRLLADGMRIFHLECHYCFITVLDRGPWPSHPWYSLRTCLYHILLHLYQQTLCQQSDETLFGHFVIALNTAFTQQLLLADEGYKSGSDTIDLPTPLQKTPCMHHVSSMEHASFNPVTTTPCSTVTITPCSTPQTPPRPVCRPLSFSSDNDQAPDSMLRQLPWRGRFSDGTTGWWTLDLQRDSWKNFLYTRTWITT